MTQPRSSRALIVIDVQESFRQEPIWRAASDPRIGERVGELVDAFRKSGELVVWVLHAEPGSDTVFDPASGFVRPFDGLEPRPGEPVVTKRSHNAFTTTNLAQILTVAAITEVVVCGIRTEQCCETTARVASDLGYSVVFALDATATTPLADPEAPPGRSLDEILADPRTLTSEQLLERTRYVLADRFARIATVAELTGSDAVGAARG